MENITYFTGAGASYHSLPLINTMGERMKIYSSFLKQKLLKKEIKSDFAPQFIVELDLLIKAEAESTSIDAYAKELTNSNKQLELHRLKAVLSSYLIFEQLIKPDGLNFYSDEAGKTLVESRIQEMLKRPLDQRYRTFWADYINGSEQKPPSNVKILSWNYDMQFEFSYSNFKQHSLELTQQDLQIFPSASSVKIDTSRFCILKLNGTAGLFSDHGASRNFNLFDLREHKLDNGNIEYLIDLLGKNYRRAMNRPLLSFAWENEGAVNETREMAKDVITNTTVLVIIGYSFPSFNREIDRELFKDTSNLKKVYVQAPAEDHESLLNRLEGISSDLATKYHRITDLNSFHIPIEH